MNKEEKMVPELRFKEFEEQWAVRDFNSMVKKRKEKFDPKKTTEALPCIELESIQKEKGILLEVFNSEDQSSIKNKFYKGDVLLGKLRPKLKKYLIANFDGVCSSEIWVLNGKNSTNEFVYYLIQTYRFYKSTLVTSGSKMPRADWEYISTSTFSIPSLPEQQKIADFLSAVDQKIQQLQRKKELLAQYKKGMMQRLFPPGVGQAPEIRFKDEQGNDFPEWEEKKLGDEITEFKKKSDKENQFPVLTSSNAGLLLQSEYYGENRLTYRSNLGFNIIPQEYITYRSRSDNRKFTFNLNSTGKTGIISTYYPVFKSISGNSYFIVSLLNFSQNHVGRHSVGTSQTVLSYNELKRIKFFIPTELEQQKIANFLSALDEKVTKVEQQIEQAQRFKKGLLQKMFV
ncbi:MAG: restriction endonuclease subunit S [Marivirga sp.]